MNDFQNRYPETVQQFPTTVLTTPVLFNDSYTHELLQIGLHRPPDGIDHQSVSVIGLAPSPCLLASVSRGNGLLKSARDRTGALVRFS